MAEDKEGEFNIFMQMNSNHNEGLQSENELNIIIRILQEFTEMDLPDFKRSRNKDHENQVLLKYHLMRQFWNKSLDASNMNEKLFSEFRNSTSSITDVNRSFNKSIILYLMAENSKEDEKDKGKMFEQASEAFEDCIIRLSSADYNNEDKNNDLDLKAVQILQICCHIKRKPTKHNKKLDTDIEQLKTSVSEEGGETNKIHFQLLRYAEFLQIKTLILSKIHNGESKRFIADWTEKLVNCLSECFSEAQYISPFISTSIFRSFNDMIEKISRYSISKSGGKRKFKFEHSPENADQKTDINFKIKKFHEILGISEANTRLLLDFERFLNPFTERNFIIFVDAELSDSETAKDCIARIIQSLKDTDKVSMIRVSEENGIVLPLTDSKCAKKNLEYLLSELVVYQGIGMASSKNNYSSKNMHILESILTYMDGKKELASTDTSETWIIGIHGKSMTKPSQFLSSDDKGKEYDYIKDRFERLFFDKLKMYTIILGTKHDPICSKCIHNRTLDSDNEKIKTYSQYGGLTKKNIDFITGMIKIT